MRLDTDQTPHIDQQPGRTHTILRWWTSPAGFHAERRRRLWITITAVALALAVTVSATSLWNYHGLSVPVQRPTSNISSLVAAEPALPTIGQDSTVVWEFDAGQPLSAQAASAGDEIYLVSGSTEDSGTVTALSASNGSRLWHVRLNSIADYSPVAAEDMVFIGTRAGNLIALDRDSGMTVWTTDLESSVVGSPIVDRGVLYVASNSIFAIDAETGEQLWRHDVQGTVSRPLELSSGIVSAISSDGNVYLINSTNGRRRLTFPLWFSTSAGPAVSGNTLVIPGDRAYVQALDIQQRDVPMEKAIRYWRTKLWLWNMGPPPPLPRGYLWQNRTLNGDTAYALAADDNSVFIGISEVDGTGAVVALDLATGETSWEVATASHVLAPAVLAGESVIVGTERTGILAIDKQTGNVVWKLADPGRLSTAPSLTESGLLLVPTADGLLKAVR